ncbi:MAG: HlyD family secretion protein [Desulfuromonadaceae bacterium]|nr:HlyD family secretion protein [Desulfuromonadaceae bacterium]
MSTMFALAGVVLVVAVLLWPSADERSVADQVTVTVQNGPLEIAILATGTLKARDQQVISNTVEGRTTILSLIDEGMQVEKGDLLIELDASSLQEREVDQQIVVQNADAEFVQARENLEVVKNQSYSDIEEARLASRFAEGDLEKYRQGEYPAKVKEAEAKIAVAEEELRRAEEKQSWSRILFDEKFLSQTELQADSLAAQKARIDLDLRRGELKLLKEFDHPRQLMELQADVEKTRLALQRVERKAAADVVQAEAQLQAKSSKLERERSKLEKIRQQIARTRIVAPQAGMVVYATSTQASWRGSVEPLAAGQEVRERQELIYLPSSGAKMVETKIHESDLQQIALGQPCRVRVDALPGELFAGRVETVAVLPDATSAWLNPDLKLYNVEVGLEDQHDSLRTGMNCQVEIQIASLDQTLSLPLQAVVLREGRAVVYVKQGLGVAERPVELGRSNGRVVEIRAGVEAGERVLLNPPLSRDAI